MKKIFSVLLLAFLLSGCTEQPDIAPVPTAETESAVPAIVSEIPLSQEMAMMEGYVVMQDGDVRHNAGVWVDFMERCEAGEVCTVTVVQYTQGHNDSDHTRYDLSFDGNEYTASFRKDGQMETEASQALVIETGFCDETMAPYDIYKAYILNDIVLYRDLIAEPDYEGVTELHLHAKEGEPAIKSYTDVESVDSILRLLMTAEYIPCEPENYVYGMKLLMTNRDGKQLVIELDLNQGVYRYGMQNFEYGTVSDLFEVLNIEQWPESVLTEFNMYLN